MHSGLNEKGVSYSGQHSVGCCCLSPIVSWTRRASANQLGRHKGVRSNKVVMEWGRMLADIAMARTSHGLATRCPPELSTRRSAELDPHALCNVNLVFLGEQEQQRHGSSSDIACRISPTNARWATPMK